MADLVSVFALPFMQRALLAGLLVALMSSVLGVFVVQRGLSFLGDGLAHAAFGGTALGLLVGAEQPLWVALAFTLAAALGIAWVRVYTELSSDTAIGIFFAVSVALGVLFVSLETGYNADAWSLLFGSILGIGEGELLLIAGVTALSLGFLGTFWGRLAYATFDAELAQSDGVRTRWLDTLLFALALYDDAPQRGVRAAEHGGRAGRVVFFGGPVGQHHHPDAGGLLCRRGAHSRASGVG